MYRLAGCCQLHNERAPRYHGTTGMEDINILLKEKAPVRKAVPVGA